MISGTIEEETAGTIESIKRILAEEGATLADVVRVTTYLDDARDFGRYNKVFGEHFKDAVLARTTVEARAVINTKIEMEAIAYKPRRGLKSMVSVAATGSRGSPGRHRGGRGRCIGAYFGEACCG